MPSLPMVDVNLFVYNGDKTVGAAIESVLAQSWPNIGLTLIDDGSDRRHSRIIAQIMPQDTPRSASNATAVMAGRSPIFSVLSGSVTRTIVMPKSGDDVIAPDFVQRLMQVLLDASRLRHGTCRGLDLSWHGEVQGCYPPEHCLTAIGTPGRTLLSCNDAYTSSPSFWGVYRRDAVDRLSPIRYRAGWDHVLLAELALYGEIRHVPEPLYWRRDGGKPVLQLARAATAQAHTGLSLDDPLAEQRWRTPLITTAYAHMEMFAESRLSGADRLALMREVPAIFRGSLAAPDAA